MLAHFLGEVMNRSFGAVTIPAATIGIFNDFAVIGGVFVFDLLLEPLLERFKCPLSMMNRINIGYLFSALAMVSAGVVEFFRLRLVQQEGIAGDDQAAANLSWAAQIPQYVLIGVAEIFADVGTMQLFYEAAPPAMRSLCSALEYLAIGLAGFLSSALVLFIQAVTSTNGRPGWISDNINEVGWTGVLAH